MNDMTISPQRTTVFISYAHTDDAVIVGQPRGWVKFFASTLLVTLKAKLGRSERVHLWYDREAITTGCALTTQLREQAQDADAFVVILSNSWLASPTCREELAAFLAGAEDPLSRLFVAEIVPCNDVELPPELHDRSRERFYELGETDTSSRNAVTLGWPCLENCPPPNAYFRTLLRFGSHIADVLKERLDATGTFMAPRASKGRVFVAEVSDDLEFRRAELFHYLELAGFEVVPRRNYPLAKTEFEQLAREDLRGCHAFVQLLSEFPGKRPPDLPRGFLWLQRDLAEEVGVEVVQWRHPLCNRGAKSSAETDAATAEHNKLLCGSRVVAEPFELFKKHVADRIVLLANAARMPARRTTADQLIFVNAETRDLPLAQELRHELSLDDFYVTTNLPDGKPDELREHLETQLSDCHCLILIYGHASPAWVAGQVNQFRKMKHRRQHAVNLFAVVNAPPLPKVDIGVEAHEMQRVPVEHVRELVRKALATA